MSRHRHEAVLYRCCPHCAYDPVHDVPKDGHTVPCNANHGRCVGQEVTK